MLIDIFLSFSRLPFSFAVRAAPVGHVAALAVVDVERVDPRLPEVDADAGTGRHHVATVAIAVHLGQSLGVIRRRGGLPDRGSQSNENGPSATASHLGQFHDHELWRPVQGGLMGEEEEKEEDVLL